MADITNVFKATVKTIRVREKSLGTVTGGDKTILPACRKSKSEFTTNALEVVSSIGKLRDFLLQNRRDYLSSSSSSQLGGQESRMTDKQRDQIDADAEVTTPLLCVPQKNFSWYSVLSILSRSNSAIKWRLYDDSLYQFVHIEPRLLNLFENIIGVRFFETQCRFHDESCMSLSRCI